MIKSNIMQNYKQITEQFEKVKDLDSMVFVEIPQKQIVDSYAYKQWVIKLEMKWMEEFNQGNANYYPHFEFNRESGINGFFGDLYFPYCKLYRFDGTEHAFSEDDYRTKRGFLIREHYSEFDVVKVQLITGNLVEFLKQEGIEYNRRDFKRRS